MEEKVKSLLAEKLDISVEQVVDSAKIMEDLGADSLDTVEIVMELEEEFEIQIPEEEADNLITVGDIVTYVQENA